MAIDFRILDKDLMNMRKRVKGVKDVVLHRNGLDDDKLSEVLAHFREQEIRRLHIFENVVGPKSTMMIQGFLGRNLPGNL